MKYFISIAFFMFMGLQIFASDNDMIINDANKAYTDGHYEQAIELYEDVLDSGYESQDLYYNLGNSYFKINNIPAAILYYEKSLKLDPNDDDAKFNLRVANSLIIDKIDEVPVMFYKRWWKNIHDLFGPNTWARITVLLFFIFLVFLAVYMVGRSYFIKKFFFWMAIIFFVITIFSFSFSLQKYNRSIKTKEAIVFDPSRTVKSSPDEGSVDLFVIHEGTKVNILENIGEWYEIRIANGSVGWIPMNSIRPI